PGEDWDEAELRARAAEETVQAVEEAQPGKVEEVAADGGAGPSVTESSNAEMADSGTPRGGDDRLSTNEGEGAAAAVAGPPAGGLEIWRRKVKHQPFPCG